MCVFMCVYVCVLMCLCVVIYVKAHVCICVCVVASNRKDAGLLNHCTCTSHTDVSMQLYLMGPLESCSGLTSCSRRASSLHSRLWQTPSPDHLPPGTSFLPAGLPWDMAADIVRWILFLCHLFRSLSIREKPDISCIRISFDLEAVIQMRDDT